MISKLNIYMTPLKLLTVHLIIIDELNQHKSVEVKFVLVDALPHSLQFFSHVGTIACVEPVRNREG